MNFCQPLTQPPNLISSEKIGSILYFDVGPILNPNSKSMSTWVLSNSSQLNYAKRRIISLLIDTTSQIMRQYPLKDIIVIKCASWPYA